MRLAQVPRLPRHVLDSEAGAPSIFVAVALISSDEADRWHPVLCLFLPADCGEFWCVSYFPSLSCPKTSTLFSPPIQLLVLLPLVGRSGARCRLTAPRVCMRPCVAELESIWTGVWRSRWSCRDGATSVGQGGPLRVRFCWRQAVRRFHYSRTRAQREWDLSVPSLCRYSVVCLVVRGGASWRNSVRVAIGVKEGALACGSFDVRDEPSTRSGA